MITSADRHRDLFSSQTLSGELKFFAGDKRCFLGRNVMNSWYDRREDGHFSTYDCSIFSLYKLPKTVIVAMLLLFGPVTLLCGTFVFI